MDDAKPETPHDRARRRWGGATPQTAAPEPGNVAPLGDAALARLAADPLHVRPIRQPDLLAFLGAVARAEVQGKGVDDILVADRFDLQHVCAVAMEAGFLDQHGRLTEAARDFADDQLSPLLPLLLARPRHE